MLSPEINAMKAQMTASIVRDSEGFFDDPKESEDLQITVRIACEFFVFLQQSNDAPELGEAEYMAGTIRSGLDWFFSMAQTGSVLTGLKLQHGFGPNLPRTFSELKASYESVFHQSDWIVDVPHTDDVPIHNSLFPIVPVIFKQNLLRLVASPSIFNY